MALVAREGFESTARASFAGALVESRIMPAPPPQQPDEGLSGAPLWTLTVVLVLVSGLLFYFAQLPMAQAFDAIVPELEEEAPERAEPTTAAEEPTADEAPPPPPPPEPWIRHEIAAAVAESRDGVLALVEEARAELPTYEDLGSSDEAQSRRAAARFERWGTVWRNRVDVQREILPPPELCAPVDPEPATDPSPEPEPTEDADTEPDGDEAEPAVVPLRTERACLDMHALLADLAAVAGARTYDEAEALLEVAAERVEEPRLVAFVSP